MSWGAELFGAACVGGGALLALLAAELWARLGRPAPELPRKLVHLGGGLACLGFPFLVRSPWTVLAMALVLSGGFLLAGRVKALRCLSGVSRPTRGGEYYPLAVFLVYVLAYGKPWLFVSSVLTLAVADTCAALVGSRWGRVRYQVEDESKSLEGSLAFMAVTFLAVLAPALVLAGLPWPVAALSALLVAALVTGFEAISLGGADNLFVPVAVCVALGKIAGKPLSEAVYQNASLAGICTGLVLLSWRTRVFNAGAKIAFLLYAYGNWALGSWEWALPIFVGFAVYLLLEVCCPLPPERVGAVRVRTVSAVLLPPLLLLVLANSLSEYRRLFGPYLAASAAVLGMALWTYLRHRHPVARAKRLAGALLAALAGSAAVIPVLWWLERLPVNALLAPSAAGVAACLVDAVWTEIRPPRPEAPAWGPTKMLLPLVAAGAVLWMQSAGLAALWTPLE